MGISMSKSVALLLVLVFLVASCIVVAKPALSSTDVVEDSWESKAPMQQARAGLGVVAVNGKIYAIGGTTAGGQYPPDVSGGGFVGTNEEYDPATNTWTTKASMPTPRDYFAIAAYQNKIYCIGGAVGFTVDEWGVFYSYITSGVNEVYDTTTDTWVTRAPLPDDAMKFQAHVVNGKIYVMDWSYTYVYDPTDDSWALKTRMPPPYPDYDSSPISAVVDNKIIVTFEFSNFLNPSEQQKILIYDTETDSWSEGTSGPMIVIGGAAGATTGVKAPKRVYVLGPPYGFPQPANNQVYDPEADAWTTATPMPTYRTDFGVAVVNDVLYAIGGYYTDSRESWLHGLVTPVAVNEQYIPIGYGVPPEIKVVSPVNKIYNESSVSLVFTVDKPVNWMGYSLNGENNVTIAGNTTLSGLPNSAHNLTVYVTDQFGNTGASETVYFNVDAPEPFPTTLVVASVILVAVIGLGLLVYFKKYRRQCDSNDLSGDRVSKPSMAEKSMLL
jgi:N-acetylneuraminic acid mutarotase